MPNTGAGWEERQAAIRELVAAEAIHSQGELLARLKRRGFTATQPSVSRDLQELGVGKVQGRYVLAGALNAKPAAAKADPLGAVSGAVGGFKAAGPNILVVQTPPGQANAVAVAVDRSRWPEVVGTVAGDDTVLVLSTGRRHQQRIEARFAKLVREHA